MYSSTQSMALHLQKEVVSLATLWRITRFDGTVLQFTDLDDDINLDQVGVSWGAPAAAGIYVSAIGYTGSAMKSSVDLSVDKLEVNGIIDNAGVSEIDLRAGKFDNALVEIGLINWRTPEDGVIYLRRGYFGEVQVQEDKYTVQLESLNSLLEREIVSIYTIGWRADLGDTKGKINIDVEQTQDGNTIRRTGTVLEVLNAYQFKANMGVNPPSGYFTEGALEWTGVPSIINLNGGRRVEVEGHSQTGSIHTFTLLFPMTRPMSVGDDFLVYAGCNRTMLHCGTKFGPADGRGNTANFRGFPHISNLDKAYNANPQRQVNGLAGVQS